MLMQPQGYYCVGCEKYMDESEMDADKNCPIHLTPCSLRREENHFFRLSRPVYVSSGGCNVGPYNNNNERYQSSITVLDETM